MRRRACTNSKKREVAVAVAAAIVSARYMYVCMRLLLLTSESFAAGTAASFSPSIRRGISLGSARRPLSCAPLALPLFGTPPSLSVFTPRFNRTRQIHTRTPPPIKLSDHTCARRFLHVIPGLESYVCLGARESFFLPRSQLSYPLAPFLIASILVLI